MTPDEHYVSEERLAILCDDGEVTPEAESMALDDVERFRAELAAQEKAEQLRKQPKRNL